MRLLRGCVLPSGRVLRRERFRQRCRISWMWAVRRGIAVMTATALSSAFCLATGCALWCCGGTTSGPADAGGSDASGADTRTPEASADAVSDSSLACGEATSAASCEACCGSLYAAGMAAFNQYVAACICTPSLCASSCSATYCANPLVVPAETDPCYTCAENAEYSAAGNCANTVLSACVQSSECKLYAECLNQECTQDR
jgi:hypothetical protein